ncbi:Serine/threonine-protein kinase pkn1 [Streptomyces sp. YIM 130001]|uniref:formylglycine-generating enzyme family protein n=1 Tax=Streptomyces sp. YIM 130001 TaxID=2259644 RepID=UPI000E6585DF|nr:formylglycine-generating enzyme family protein [Streptomyces sp. YIM 130001]RII17870.1 Serine/threonine-protein kinase pkn1 [Streptomyces sp. YIM 130001]
MHAPTSDNSNDDAPSCCAPSGPARSAPVGIGLGPRPSAAAPGELDAAYADRVELPGGSFRMGSEDTDAHVADGEGPVRSVTVAPFAIDAYAVTNARFAAFVRATGYRTETEEFGWSYVFAKFLPGPLRGQSQRPASAPWWCAVEGAAWNAPEGPGSGLDGRADHPVTHVTWTDAEAFARWSGGRLPQEEEWEYAARGGLDQRRYPWGDELTPGGEHRCNIWQGKFPSRNTEEDGYTGTAPVDTYAPNGFGLYNTVGNVWEWSADLWQQGDDTRRVMRGGSYLCHDSYCNRYRVAARTSNTSDSSAGNLGFRLAWDIG